MESMISAAYVAVNEGFTNSEIGIKMSIVYQGSVSGESERDSKPHRLLRRCRCMCGGRLLASWPFLSAPCAVRLSRLAHHTLRIQDQRPFADPSPAHPNAIVAASSARFVSCSSAAGGGGGSGSGSGSGAGAGAAVAALRRRIFGHGHQVKLFA